MTMPHHALPSVGRALLRQRTLEILRAISFRKKIGDLVTGKNPLSVGKAFSRLGGVTLCDPKQTVRADFGGMPVTGSLIPPSPQFRAGAAPAYGS